MFFYQIAIFVKTIKLLQMEHASTIIINRIV